MVGLRGLRVLSAVLGMAAIAATACGSSSDDGGAAACNPQIDPFKELVVVEPQVIDDARARNDVNGVWSFRHAVESMTAPGGSTSALVLDWLRVWTSQTTFNGSQIDREPRDTEMNRSVICPWLRATPANACDEACSACAKEELDMAKAPFRLIAIANRMDLRESLVNKVTPAGEGRLLFALTDGPADDPASQPRAFTVIFEYSLPESKTVKEWAEAWHALGKHAAYDEAYKADLEKVTEGFVARNALPGNPNGSALSQLRTNESTLNWIWQLREFRLDRAGGRLILASTKNTPLETLNNSPILASWVSKNAEAIKQDKYSIPESLLGGSSNAFMFRWSLPNIDEDTRRAFSQGTCSGCHTGDTSTSARDNAFHVSPFGKDRAKLSTFVYDPTGKSKDEVVKRTSLHQAALCGP